jgi:hypothetical protein
MASSWSGWKRSATTITAGDLTPVKWPLNRKEEPEGRVLLLTT